ncbi:hypothetical protein REPUB_Repub11eG0060400 [Reevesia pubescens]
MEIDWGDDQNAWGRVLRVRDLLNVTKPIRRGFRITLPEGGTVLVLFRYEKLPNICFVYGCLNHYESECETIVQMKKNTGSVKREYNIWLSVDSSGDLPNMVSIVTRLVQVVK